MPLGIGAPREARTKNTSTPNIQSPATDAFMRGRVMKQLNAGGFAHAVPKCTPDARAASLIDVHICMCWPRRLQPATVLPA
jgi:hypothetical protein